MENPNSSSVNYIHDYNQGGTYFRIDCDTYVNHSEFPRPLTALSARCVSVSKLHPINLFFNPLYVPRLLLSGGDPQSALSYPSVRVNYVKTTEDNGFTYTISMEHDRTGLFYNTSLIIDIHFTGSTQAQLKTLKFFEPRRFPDGIYSTYSERSYFITRGRLQTNLLWETGKFLK